MAPVGPNDAAFLREAARQLSQGERMGLSDVYSLSFSGCQEIAAKLLEIANRIDLDDGGSPDVPVDVSEEDL